MRRYLFLLILIMGLLPATVQAAAGPWQRDNDVAVRLIAGVDGTGEAATVPLGLEIQLAPGWHTYWRAPGYAGMPPRIDWQKSQTESGNLQSAALLYPAPTRFEEQGMESIGYNGHVVLPIDAHVRVPGKPLALDASLDILLCGNICVPKHYELTLAVPPGAARPSPEAPLIDAARAQVPGGTQQSGFAVSSVKRKSGSIAITVQGNKTFMVPDLFVENDAHVEFAKPLVEPSPDKLSVTFTLKPAEKLPEGISLETLPLTVTIVDGARALEQKLDASFVPQPVPPAASAAKDASGSSPENTPALWVFIVLAVLGGFILNLTPCVLPVLSLKVLSVISHGGGETRAVRRSFLTTAAGIMFSFLVLAGATILLKETGRAVGWGVQFQQPPFLVFLVLLLTLFAANLWDMYVITLPGFLTGRFDPVYHPRLAGDFVTGAFATLLATPCTVPFLGTAVGFALAEGP
ncbi:MAG: protein-disulfide reductase DsbD family protein [Alphaproteobacteria bacterium]|nr:protein-disulfide reductase DsbD family protein [Alphaproteobacteria bacterium]